MMGPCECEGTIHHNHAPTIEDAQTAGRIPGLAADPNGTRTPEQRIAQKQARGVDTRSEERAVASRSQAETDRTTREFCQRCHRVSPVGFYSPLWNVVAVRHWSDSILCIICFAQLGDEMHVAWEEGIEFYPVSYATHHASRTPLV